MWRFRILLLGAAAIPSLALAQAIDTKGAAQLKTLFENALEHTNFKIEGARPYLEYEGGVSVEQTDNYYAVTLPPLRVNYSSNTTLDVGIISINATPHEEREDRWKMSFALPTPMVLYGKENTEIFQLDIDGQRAAGIWDEDFESFIKLDAIYQNIEVTAGEYGRLSIPEAQIRYDFTENEENGYWSGPTVSSVKDLTVEFGKSETKISIDSAQVKANIDDYNVKAAQDFKTKIRDFTQKIQENSKAVLDKNIPAEKKHEIGKTMQKMNFQLFAAFVELLENMGNGASIEYSLNGFSLLNPQSVEDDKEASSKEIKLDHAMFGFALNGLDEGAASLAVKFGFDGAGTVPPANIYDSPIIPSAMNIDMRLQDIAFEKLTAAAQPALQSMAQNPDLAMIIGIGLISTLPAILSEAGTKLIVDKSFIEGDGFRIEFDGALNADPGAMTGFSGRMNGLFTGLDEMIEKTERLQFDPKVKDTQGVKRLLTQLTALQTVGRKDEDSKPSRYRFDIEIQSAGAVLLNGQDFWGIAKGIEIFPEEKRPATPPHEELEEDDPI